MRVGTVVAVAGILLACSNGSSPTGPDSARLGVPFTLNVGETVSIRGEPVTIGFERVLSDSRCPTDVTCVWRGEVVASLRIEIEGSPHTFALSTEITPRGTIGGYEVLFRRAAPGPSRSTEPIPPERYRIELVATK